MTSEYETLTDAECVKRWECYALSFSSTAEDGLCLPCMVRDRCIKRMPLRLAELRELAGRELPPAELAPLCDTDEDSIRLVQAVAAGKPIAAFLPPQKVPALVKAEEPAEADVGDNEADQLLEEAAAPAPPPPPVQTRPTVVVQLVEQPKKKAPPKVATPPQELTVQKKTKAKAAPPKKAPPKKVAVKKPAEKVAPKKAAAVKPPAAKGAPDIAAFRRERDRSTWVGKLRHGQVLERRFNGELLRVQVDTKQGGYLLNNRVWPTLYGLVMALTGPTEAPDGRVMSKWSVKRFFARSE